MLLGSATCVYRCGFLLLTTCGSLTCDKVRADCGQVGKQWRWHSAFSIHKFKITSFSYVYACTLQYLTVLLTTLQKWSNIVQCVNKEAMRLSVAHSTHCCSRSNSDSIPGILPNIVCKVKTWDRERTLLNYGNKKYVSYVTNLFSNKRLVFFFVQGSEGDRQSYVHRKFRGFFTQHFLTDFLHLIAEIS